MERRNSAPADSSINNKDCNSNGKIEGSEYIPARCRITKPNPPKPAQNPLQFVKVGPCDLYRSAQEQLKKVQVIKKLKEDFKDESADWQSNLDNWKSSRRKRQEHIIERVVEIKNMEEQEKARRRSKTFSEMLEDRNSRRRKLSNLAVYAENDGNDLSELGISTSSSRKGSISGDSTTDDGNSTRDSDEANNMSERNNSTESNGYQLDNEKSDKGNNQTGKNEEYTYESAIQGYKSRVNRNYRDQIEQNSVTSSSGSKSEPRKTSYFTFQSLSESSNELNFNNNANTSKVDVPKVDISERKHIFESGKNLSDLNESRNLTSLSDELSQSKSIKERLKHLEKCTEESLKIKKATKLLSGDIMTVRDRLSSLVSHASDDRNNNMPSWASASQLSSTNESNHESPNSLDEKEQNDCNIISLSHIDKSRVFHCSLDSLDVRDVQQSSCMLQHVQSLDGLDFCERSNYPPSVSSTELLALSQCGDTDREDSGIQTADVSCSVSQADDPDDDSDTMAVIHTGCVDQHFNAIDTSVKSYVSDSILPSSPTSSEQVDSNNFSTKSDASVVEELITCTINMDLCKFNEKFQDKLNQIDLNGIVPITDPLAPPKSMDPPKEKPPPPPVDALSDDDETLNDLDSSSSELKRLNSTKRIKNEIRNKRSSFLGIEDLSDNFEINLTKPRDATTILQEELQLEKQLYRQSQSYQYSLDMSNSRIDVESRDSGVELEPRSISEPDHDLNCIKANISLQDEDEISKKEREIIENLEKEEQWRRHYNSSRENSYNLSQNICESDENLMEENPSYGNESRFIDQDVLRVKRELLEIEQEDLERQREDLYQNRKLSHLETVPLAAQTVGLPDVYMKNKTENLYANFPNYYQNSTLNGSPPIRSNPSNSYSEMQLPGSSNAKETPITANPMSRHTLHALSAAPRSKLMNTDSWIQSQSTKKTPTLTSTQDRQNYNQHWLIQEAEQRRLSEPPRPTRGHFNHRTPEKQIPRAVVQNLTQRLQNRPTASTASTRLLKRKDMPGARSAPLPLVPSSYGPLPNAYERGRSLPNSALSSHGPPPPPPPVVAPPNTLFDLHDKMLSVSGKKKCSHCGDELGRGAAMIIESLCLFYHMDCFKCCVCHVQLGDGLMGTDVRVRNHKLHCHNCYSSDDGVKFSCV